MRTGRRGGMGRRRWTRSRRRKKRKPRIKGRLVSRGGIRI